MTNLRSKCAPGLRPCPRERSVLVELFLGNPPSPNPSTDSEKRMEQLIFDIHLNSPSKARRQLKCLSENEKKMRDSIMNPTENEKIMEQFVFDIYLRYIFKFL